MQDTVERATRALALRAKASRVILGKARGLLVRTRQLTAPLYRRLILRRVVFVGVTGSCGKTTSKELIAAVLSARFAGSKSDANDNLPRHIAAQVFRIKPWHKFHVQEIAAAARGRRIPLETPLKIVRPQIGVVTHIGDDHISAFQTLAAIAAEKGKLVAALPQHGIAILNADDPNVLAMQARCVGRVMTYGLAQEAMVRAENVRSIWPERLSFTVSHDGQAYDVHTRLCGKHLVSSVLAAIAVGVAMGIPLATAVKAIEAAPPYPMRMCPIHYGDDITFIRDDRKAPLWSIAPALEFMKDAQARRKVVVIGTISDYKGNSDRQYVSVARQALEVADCVVFVGSRASKCLKARRSPQDDSLRAFYSVEAAREYLCPQWRPGDLILLKGTMDDHLNRLFAEGAVKEDQPFSAGQSQRREGPLGERPAHVVVGLGNPGEQYRDTPHNVGHCTVDLLVRSFGGEWVQEGQALVSRVERQDATVFLIKPLTHMNSTGSVLAKLSQELGFDAADCVLVQDDIDLPVGTVRVRATGGDGGHKGIRSILEAFRTDTLRRVKIGVRLPERGRNDHVDVLKPFAPTELSLIERACAEAAELAIGLLRKPEAISATRVG